MAKVIVLTDLVQSLESFRCHSALSRRRRTVSKHVDDAVDMGLRSEIHPSVHGLVVHHAFLQVASVRLVGRHLLEVIRHLDELARRTECTDAQVLQLTEGSDSYHVNLDEQVLHDIPTDQHLLPSKHAILLRHNHVCKNLGLVEQTNSRIQRNLAVVDAIELDAVVQRGNLRGTKHASQPC